MEKGRQNVVKMKKSNQKAERQKEVEKIERG